MFNIDNTKKVSLEFNTNKLIIKSNKNMLVDTPVQPREVKPSNQAIQPAGELVSTTMFEIY